MSLAVQALYAIPGELLLGNDCSRPHVLAVSESILVAQLGPCLQAGHGFMPQQFCFVMRFLLRLVHFTCSWHYSLICALTVWKHALCVWHHVTS